MGALIVSRSAHQTRTELMVVRFRLRKCRRKTDGVRAKVSRNALERNDVVCQVTRQGLSRVAASRGLR